ncbi:MAG: hypothetical protein J7639_17990 [Paenibacillaceae bacterium]|nr:hypothetical protein [Paenibacillaceae bacterium]
MNIVNVNVYDFHTQRVHTTQAAALGGKEHRVGGVTASDFAIVELRGDDGSVGYGEISDIPDTMLSPAGVQANAAYLQAYLREQLIGRDAAQFESLLAAYPDPALVDLRTDGTVYDILGCGVDMALLDLLVNREGAPISARFGPRLRNEVKVSWVIFIRDPELIEAEVETKVREGFHAFKLKVGINAKDDEERLRIVRRMAGDDAHIKIDANSGWSFDEAVDNMRRLEKYNPAGIETPIPYLDVEGKARLKRKIGTPVIEHVNTLAFGEALVAQRAVDVFNLCPAGSGGLLKARRILDLAREEGIPCLLGSTVEAGLGTAAQLQLAAGAEPLTWPSDLVGPQLYVNDYIKETFSYSDGWLRIPDGPGWGVTVDRSKLAGA